MEYSAGLNSALKAIDTLRQKYPDLRFDSDFEPTIREHRGILDIRIIKKVENQDDVITLSMIIPGILVPPNMAEADAYLRHIEQFLQSRGIVSHT